MTMKVGDKVSWNSSKGKTSGEIIEVVTSDSKAKEFHVTASKTSPKYKVKSDKTGKTALHTEDALTKL